MGTHKGLVRGPNQAGTAQKYRNENMPKRIDKRDFRPDLSAHWLSASVYACYARGSSIDYLVVQYQHILYKLNSEQVHTESRGRARRTLAHFSQRIMRLQHAG